MLYVITFMLALCSILYELVLGQALSAFLGNTVLRYSMTIGLYMMSLGIGSLVAEGRFTARPVVTLLIIEILLVLIGASSVAMLFLVDANLPSQLGFSIFAHGLIVVIGVLSGFEIPLLIKLKSLEKNDSHDAIIGTNYLGAFLGTIAFTLILHPHIGIIKTALWIAMINSLVGISLISQRSQVPPSEKKLFYSLSALNGGLFIGLVVFLLNAELISKKLLEIYLLE